MRRTILGAALARVGDVIGDPTETLGNTTSLLVAIASTLYWDTMRALINSARGTSDVTSLAPYGKAIELMTGNGTLKMKSAPGMYFKDDVAAAVALSRQAAEFWPLCCPSSCIASEHLRPQDGSGWDGR